MLAIRIVTKCLTMNIVRERGRVGYIFCDLIAPNIEDCYNRDYIQRDCDKNPENSRCTGLIEKDGLVFCDLDPDADPCYDRDD
jgi:hypothetical protein